MEIAIGRLDREQREDRLAASHPRCRDAARAPPAACSVPAAGAVTVTAPPGGAMTSPPTLRVRDTLSIAGSPFRCRGA